MDRSQVAIDGRHLIVDSRYSRNYSSEFVAHSPHLDLGMFNRTYMGTSCPTPVCHNFIRGFDVASESFIFEISRV
jgi:hypothetical protein